jgi:hypothetical protein
MSGVTGAGKLLHAIKAGIKKMNNKRFEKEGLY